MYFDYLRTKFITKWENGRLNELSEQSVEIAVRMSEAKRGEEQQERKPFLFGQSDLSI